MKKITLLLTVLITAFSFGQEYSSKADAISGIHTISPSSGYLYAPSRNVQTAIFSEDFENGLGTWITIDNDGDTYDWDSSLNVSTQWNAHSGSGCATSASWVNSTVGAVTPDNWLISPSIDLSNITGTVFLEWFVEGQDQTWANEVYRVLVSTTGINTTDFTEVYPDETVQAAGPDGNNYWKRTLDISQFDGQTIHVAFQHHNCTDQFYLNIDDVSVYQNTVVDAGVTAVMAPNNDSACTLTNAEVVTATIYNYGGSALTDFSISYSIDASAPVTENVTGVNIAPATSYDYTFTRNADLSALGYYDVMVTVALPNDADASNDSFTQHVTNGDANLVVTVQSDGVGRQSWQLLNSAGDIIASHGAYQWNITETTTVCLLDADCYTFNWVMTDQTVSPNNDVTLTYNGQQVNHTNATGDFDVYAIGGNCAPVDIKLASIDMPDVAVIGNNTDVSGMVQNIGTDAITSYDVNYTVNAGTAVGVYSVTGVNIANGQSASFTHNIPFVPATSDNATIEVSISNVNAGSVETSLADNTLSKEISVATQTTQNMPLYEEFTASTCGPCYSFNTDSFNMTFLNANTGHYNLIKYQMNWPGSGDVYYTAEGGVRRTYYDVSGVPTLFLEGSVGPDFFQNPTQLQPKLDEAYAAPAYFDMTASYAIDATSHDITVDVNWDAYLSGNYTLHCAVVEKTTTGNVGNNGETSFHNVMMKMLPNASGTSITTTAGAFGSSQLSGALANTFVEDWNDLEVVVFMQDDTNKTVMQSTKAVLQTSGVQDVTFTKVRIYPNPSNGQISIDNAAGMQIQIVDVLGNVVYTNNNLSVSNSLVLNNLSNGVYFVRLHKGNKTGLRKIVIAK